MIIDPLGNIPIERGGTGATTIEEVKEKLGVNDNYTVLYSSYNGSKGPTFTLSDDYTNYTLLEVYYSGYCSYLQNSVHWGSSMQSCAKMYRPSGTYKQVFLSSIDAGWDEWQITICRAHLEFSGTTATLTADEGVYYELNGGVKAGTATRPNIYAIIGYK